MTPRQFIEAVYDAVYSASIFNTMSILENPPGRRPDKKLLNLSKWFNLLSQSDKEMVEAVTKLCAEETVFGFLAILDGVRQVENFDAKGYFELFFNKNNQHYLINDKSKEYLHDIFKDTIID